MHLLQITTLLIVMLVGLFAGQTAAAADESAGNFIHQLEEFGPLQPGQVQATWEAAVQTLRESGGVLVVPAQVWPQIRSTALQGLARTPEPPEETKRWQNAPGVTAVTADAQRPIVQVPPLSGLELERMLRLDPGDSLPHWGTHPMLTLDSQLVHGSISYLDWLQAPVAKGKDRRFYLPTVRGLWPGQFLIT